MPEAREAYEGLRDYGLNLEFSPRADIVGDDLSNGSEVGYGNPDVHATDPRHGTHVSGIIGAVRGNGLGIDGIAADVRLMAIRAVPDGDERDKDVANAIRYAVDNGAHIIQHELREGILTPEGAGRCGRALRRRARRPHGPRGGQRWRRHRPGEQLPHADPRRRVACRSLDRGRRRQLAGRQPCGAVLELRSDPCGTSSLPAWTSSRPVPGSEYDREDGTSMAAPVVSGVAALLMSYFPDLDASDVRRIILESSVKYDTDVVARPGDGARIPFGRLSVTGGVVNVYEAVRMALERM